jgi:histone H3/H4
MSDTEVPATKRHTKKPLKRTALTKGTVKRILFRGGVDRTRSKVLVEDFPAKAEAFLESVVPCVIDMTRMKKRNTVRTADVVQTLQDLGLTVMLGAV